MKQAQARYAQWMEKVTDATLAAELAEMANDPERIREAFGRELAFGTGGLRGLLGAGSNRMNVYTVAKATSGLAQYLLDRYTEEIRVAIGYDSRMQSDVFAKTAAAVLQQHGICAFRFEELMPTPCLSYAVRQLGCRAGIMITASHNPAVYNGYKVYGEDGCQITDKAAAAITSFIEKADPFALSHVSEAGLPIGEEVYRSYLQQIRAISCLSEARDLRIVYTPLNGTGRKPVTDALSLCGFTDVTVVPEQELPDGRFPTCPYPNPEEPEAMALGVAYAQKIEADLVLATDPDCDRVGVAVRDRTGEYRLLTGNETGLLLLEYVCEKHVQNGTLPPQAICVKTIVTTALAQQVAARYGVQTVNVLTGFKYIGEQIGQLEACGEAERYIFGFEESYGYLSGTHVRDKDGVNAAVLIADMAAFYKQRGETLVERLASLYATYGYCLNTLHTYRLEGAQGRETMHRLLCRLRESPCPAGVAVTDYQNGVAQLPKADVLQFDGDGFTVVVRPSGTEPKLKLYTSVTAEDRETARAREQNIVTAFEQLL